MPSVLPARGMVFGANDIRWREGQHMFQAKRVTVAVAFGFAMGLICYLGGTILFHFAFSTPEIINIFVNRMLIGFVIGISVLKMDWHTHGLLIGSIVGLPYLLYDYMSGKGLLVVVTLALLNPLFGLLIEYFTSKVFKLYVRL
jgi:hypothetical protein